MINVRISRFPLLSKCLGALNEDKLEIKIDQDHPIKNLGNAGHAVAEQIVLNDGVRPPIELYAEEYGVDDNLWGDLGWMTWYVVELWNDIRIIKDVKYPPMKEIYLDPLIEREVKVVLPEITITGHIDVAGYHPELPRLNITDWKFGYATDIDTFPQLKGYAAASLISRLYSDMNFDEVRVTVEWLRENTYKAHTFKTADLIEWFNDFTKRIVNWDGKTYNPGTHCDKMYCPMRFDCPAKNQMMYSGVQALMVMPTLDKQFIFNEGISFREKNKMVIRMCEENLKIIDSHLYKYGFIIDHDGNKLVLGDPAEMMNAESTMKILYSEGFTDEQMIQFLKPTKTMIGELARIPAAEKKEAGEKTSISAEKNRILELLREKGALKRKGKRSVKLILPNK